MPIKAQERAQKSLTRLGIIRLGTKKTSASGKEYPSEAPFFVLKDAPELVPSYGDQPTEILIYLPFPTIDENLIVFHEAWKAWGCLCRGDGDKIISLRSDDGARKLVVDGHTDQGEVLPCPGENYQPGRNGYPRCADCKPSMMLRVLVRDRNNPDKAVGGLGFYQVRSHSMANILSLTGQLRYVEDMAHKMGSTLQGIGMKLKRVQRETSYVDEKDGQRKKTLKWFIDLEFDVAWVERAQARVKQLAMGETVPMLPAVSIPSVWTEPVTELPSTTEVASTFEEGEYINEEADGRLFDLAAMRDNLPGNWKDFHAIIGQAWGEDYKSGVFNAAVQERLGLPRPVLDLAFWNGAIDLLIERVKGQA